MDDLEKRRKQAEADERQRLINEADRPRLRALEQAAMSAPGYYSRQPDQPLGQWRVDGGPGVPDGTAGYMVYKGPPRYHPPRDWAWVGDDGQPR